MDIDDLIRLIEGVTTGEPPTDDTARQQVSVLNQLEAQRRDAYWYYLNGAYLELLKTKADPPEVAARASIFAKFMVEAWDAGLLMSFERGKELREKFGQKSAVEAASKKEKH